MPHATATASTCHRDASSWELVGNFREVGLRGNLLCWLGGRLAGGTRCVLRGPRQPPGSAGGAVAVAGSDDGGPALRAGLEEIISRGATRGRMALASVRLNQARLARVSVCAVGAACGAGRGR